MIGRTERTALVVEAYENRDHASIIDTHTTGYRVAIDPQTGEILQVWQKQSRGGIPAIYDYQSIGVGRAEEAMAYIRQQAQDISRDPQTAEMIRYAEEYVRSPQDGRVTPDHVVDPTEFPENGLNAAQTAARIAQTVRGQ